MNQTYHSSGCSGTICLCSLRPTLWNHWALSSLLLVGVLSLVAPILLHLRLLSRAAVPAAATALRVGCLLL